MSRKLWSKKKLQVRNPRIVNCLIYHFLEEPESSVAVNADAKEKEVGDTEEPEVQQTSSVQFQSQDVGAEVDQKTEAEEPMEEDIVPNTEPRSEVFTGVAAALENNGTLGLEDLDIEKEDEREQQAQAQKFDEDEFELPDDLFFGFNFFVPGYTAENADAIYKDKITKCGGTVMNSLDFSITHVFFQEK
jgi:hypothetical protein